MKIVRVNQIFQPPMFKKNMNKSQFFTYSYNACVITELDTIGFGRRVTTIYFFFFFLEGWGAGSNEKCIFTFLYRPKFFGEKLKFLEGSRPRKPPWLRDWALAQVAVTLTFCFLSLSTVAFFFQIAFAKYILYQSDIILNTICSIKVYTYPDY